MDQDPIVYEEFEPRGGGSHGRHETLIRTDWPSATFKDLPRGKWASLVEGPTTSVTLEDRRGNRFRLYVGRPMRLDDRQTYRMDATGVRADESRDIFGDYLEVVGSNTPTKNVPYVLIIGDHPVPGGVVRGSATWAAIASAGATDCLGVGLDGAREVSVRASAAALDGAATTQWGFNRGNDGQGSGLPLLTTTLPIAIIPAALYGSFGLGALRDASPAVQHLQGVGKQLVATLAKAGSAPALISLSWEAFL